jgi:hypothetical protein
MLDQGKKSNKEYAEGGVITTSQLQQANYFALGGDPIKPKPRAKNYDPLYTIEPQVAESTAIRNLPKQDKKVVEKAIAKKEAERKVVAQKIQANPLLTQTQKDEILLDPRKLDENVNLAYEKGPDTIQQVEPQSTASRTWEYITNPMTAAEYAISGGGAENMPRNINEMRMAGIDPGVVADRNLVGNTLNYTTNLFDAGDKVVRNLGEGNYGTAALEAMRFLPGARMSTGLGKQAANISKSAIQNTYKINPWAFKPNPNAYYRMIGKEGYADALESGMVRPPQTTRIFDQSSQKYIDIPIPAYEEAYYNAQYPLDRRWYPNSIKKTNPQKAALATKSGYQGPYMAEVTGDSHLFEKGENVAAYTGPNSSQTVTYSKEHIPITNPNLKFYKEHWLKGYKEVPKPGTENIVKAGSGGMDMSRYEIANPDYFTQLLDTYTSKQLPPSSKKFYKGLIESVKKQDGIVTERQYQELQRLKTGNFNYGKKAYQEGGKMHNAPVLTTSMLLKRFK